MEKFIRFGKFGTKSINYLALNSAQQSDLCGVVDIETYIAMQKSINVYPWRDADLNKIFENGISVFRMGGNNLPILENLDQIKSLAARIDKDAFIVYGNAIGTGQDGEPVIEVCKTERIEIPRKKLADLIIQDLKRLYPVVSGVYDESGKKNIQTFCDYETDKKTVCFSGLEFTEE